MKFYKTCAELIILFWGFQVISGKKYTVKVSKASGFCSVPVNLNWYIYFDKSPYTKSPLT